LKLLVTHHSSYVFEPPTRGVVQSLRLTPSIFDGQSVKHWSVTVEGAEMGASFRDGCGDWVQTVSMLGPVSEMTVLVEGEVHTTDLAGILRGHRGHVPPAAYLRSTRATRPDKGLRKLSETTLASFPDASPLEQAHALSAAVSEAIAYRPGETHAHTTAAEALSLGLGVCQDHAHALISVAHAADMPARYVTGYLHSTDDGQAHEASHAWAEIHVSGLGWVGFDPSNQCCPDERYIRLGSGYDAMDAAPIRGIAKGAGDESLQVSVAVQQAAQ
jgi:transglutaminase-like putative cysteine protease